MQSSLFLRSLALRAAVPKRWSSKTMPYYVVVFMTRIFVLERFFRSGSFSILEKKFVLGSGLMVHRDTPENSMKMRFKFTPENMKKVNRIINNYPEGYKVWSQKLLKCLGFCL